MRVSIDIDDSLLNRAIKVLESDGISLSGAVSSMLVRIINRSNQNTSPTSPLKPSAPTVGHTPGLAELTKNKDFGSFLRFKGNQRFG